MRLPLPEVPAAHHLQAMIAKPAADHASDVRGTLCVNCGQIILRQLITVPSELRPGHTIRDHFGPWEHLQGAGDGPDRVKRQLCSSVRAGASA